MVGNSRARVPDKARGDRAVARHGDGAIGLQRREEFRRKCRFACGGIFSLCRRGATRFSSGSAGERKFALTVRDDARKNDLR